MTKMKETTEDNDEHVEVNQLTYYGLVYMIIKYCELNMQPCSALS